MCHPMVDNMKRFLPSRRALYVAGFLFIAAPLYVYAQTTKGLVPCGNPTGAFNGYTPAYFLQATSCNICYLAVLIQEIVNFLIMVAIPISVAMFAWAGIMYFTSAGNPKNIGRAHKIFSGVFWGFIIALSGWLLVQVALQAITSSDYSPSSFFNLSSCQSLDNQRPRNESIGNVLSGNGLVSGGGTNGGGTSGGENGGGGAVAVDGAAVQRAAASVELGAACANNSGTDCTLLQAVCVAESSCNPQTTGCNSAGACGPMQIQPATACEANPSLRGCMVLGNRGVILNEDAVKLSLQDMSKSADTAARILNNASSVCGGDLTCTMAYYNGGGGAVQASACCPSGTAAWQCQWDCGTRVSGSVNCTATPQPTSCKANSGYVETRNYVVKVQAAKSALTLPTVTPGGAY
jgi:hypothetical protein